MSWCYIRRARKGGSQRGKDLARPSGLHISVAVRSLANSTSHARLPKSDQSSWLPRTHGRHEGLMPWLIGCLMYLCVYGSFRPVCAECIICMLCYLHFECLDTCTFCQRWSPQRKIEGAEVVAQAACVNPPPFECLMASACD